MPEKILLMTVPPSFGELIQQTLHETGLYEVTFISTWKDAVESARRTGFDLAILDAEVAERPIIELVERIRSFCPKMKLIVIPPDNHLDDLSLAGLSIQSYLLKPFYLPDLLDMVECMLNEKALEAPMSQADTLSIKGPADFERTAPFPTWLDEPEKTAQILTSLSLESEALGILILRDGQVWAYAGQLGQPAAQEIAVIVANLGSSSMPGIQGKKCDLARFIRLGSTGGEYMLFATPLNEASQLVLLFAIDTPFNLIRSQVHQIAHSLNSPPGIRLEAQTSRSVNPAGSPRLLLPASQSLNQEERFFRDLTDQAFNKPILDDVPPPMPAQYENEQSQRKEVGQNQVFEKRAGKPSAFPGQVRPADQDKAFPPPIVHQTALPVVYDLSYFCLLIPRMPHHLLEGDLAAKLSEWLGQLCMAFGWRLEHISVRPGYLQWVVNVVPSVAPDFLVETLRKHTSERVFSTFPQLARDNPSGDFWAPGYLILTHIEQLSEQMIQSFIQQVRQYQGAASSDTSS